MKFVADTYYRAAQERMRDARTLLNDERFGLAHYVAGVAVECILRAYCWRRDPKFDARHDLLELFKRSGIARQYEEFLIDKGQNDEAVRVAANRLHGDRDTLVRIWSNNFRFASERDIRSRMLDLGEGAKLKGDILKVTGRRIATAAQSIIDAGIVLWNSKKN